MAKFSLTTLAKNDLLEIGIYTLEKWDITQKQIYLAKLNARFQWLADNPLLGSSKDEIEAGCRSFTEGKHTILYRIADNNTIEIICIPYQSMDIEQHLGISKETP